MRIGTGGISSLDVVEASSWSLSLSVSGGSTGGVVAVAGSLSGGLAGAWSVDVEVLSSSGGSGGFGASLSLVEVWEGGSGLVGGVGDWSELVVGVQIPNRERRWSSRSFFVIVLLSCGLCSIGGSRAGWSVVGDVRAANFPGSCWGSGGSGGFLEVGVDIEPFGSWPLDLSALLCCFVLAGWFRWADFALFRFGFCGCCVLLLGVSVSELWDGLMGGRKAVIAARLATLDFSEQGLLRQRSKQVQPVHLRPALRQSQPGLDAVPNVEQLLNLVQSQHKIFAFFCCCWGDARLGSVSSSAP